MLNILNRQFRTIKFTMEKEEDGQLPFLDVLVKRLLHGVEFCVYRKPTNVPRYIPSDSHCPIAHKHAAFNSLVYRLCKLPLNATAYMEELNYIKQVAFLNGYDPGIIEKMVGRHSNEIRRRNMSTLFSQTRRENKKRLRLRFAPRIANKLKKVFNKHDIDLVFSSSNKLRTKLGSLKDKTDVGQKSGIYKIDCQNCDMVIRR